jgi:hypothetical protein
MPQPPGLVTQTGPTDCLSYRTEEGNDGNGGYTVTVTCVGGGGGTGFPAPGGGGSGGGGTTSPGGGGGGSAPGLPMKPQLTPKVNEARRLAIEKLAAPQCAALFSAYTSPFNSGLFILQQWLNGFRSGDSSSGCTGNTAAHTTIAPTPTEPVYHSRWIVICDSFGHLSPGQSAVKILHETLHVAGHRERSPDTTGKTTQEIDQMVSEACGS